MKVGDRFAFHPKPMDASVPLPPGCTVEVFGVHEAYSGGQYAFVKDTVDFRPALVHASSLQPIPLLEQETCDNGTTTRV